MNIAQALNIIKPLGNTEDDLKKAYRAMCKKYHPDVNPNGLEIMKVINAAYDFLRKNLGKWAHTQKNENEQSIDEIFQEILSKIRHIPKIDIEVCGVWLWVSGDTYPYRSIFKELGMKFSGKKRAWYWHQEGYRKMSRKIFSLNEIRSMFGSQEIDTEPLSIIAAG